MSRPERSSVPGTAPVGAPSRTISVPLTRTRTTPLLAAMSRGASPGRSWTKRAGSDPTRALGRRRTGRRRSPRPPGPDHANQTRRRVGPSSCGRPVRHRRAGVPAGNPPRTPWGSSSRTCGRDGPRRPNPPPLPSGRSRSWRAWSRSFRRRHRCSATARYAGRPRARCPRACRSLAAPRSAAMSATARPAHPSFSGA